VITKKPRLKQAPAVQIYPSDIMATKEYRLMTLEQRGLFISLYLDLWVNREAPLDILVILKSIHKMLLLNIYFNSLKLEMIQLFVKVMKSIWQS
jgi:hypothetical protein